MLLISRSQVTLNSTDQVTYMMSAKLFLISIPFPLLSLFRLLLLPHLTHSSLLIMLLPILLLLLMDITLEAHPLHLTISTLD